MRLAVSLTAETPQVFIAWSFEVISSWHWNPGLHCLSHSPGLLLVYLHENVGSPSPLATASPSWSTSFHLASILSALTAHLLLLPVWMNVPSLTPWLSNFHTLQFSGSSGCSMFLNWLLSFFWLCKEAKHIYQCLHLHQNSKFLLFIVLFLFLMKIGRVYITLLLSWKFSNFSIEKNRMLLIMSFLIISPTSSVVWILPAWLIFSQCWLKLRE